MVSACGFLNLRNINERGGENEHKRVDQRLLLLELLLPIGLPVAQEELAPVKWDIRAMGRLKEYAHGFFIFVRPWEQMFPWPFLFIEARRVRKSPPTAGLTGSALGQGNDLRKKSSRIDRGQ